MNKNKNEKITLEEIYNIFNEMIESIQLSIIKISNEEDFKNEKIK